MDTRPFLDHLKRVEELLRKRIGDLRSPLAQAEKDLEHVVGVIDLYNRDMGPLPKPTTSVPTAVVVTAKNAIGGVLDIRGLSQKQAVIAIAKHNGGIVRAQEAKRMMISAGIMRETKNSTRMVHNAIITSGRFERIAPGEFRLKVVTPPSGTPVAAMASGQLPKPPVQ